MPEPTPGPAAIDLAAHHRHAVVAASDEMACHFILAFCAQRGTWAPFTLAEINAWAPHNGWGVPMALDPLRFMAYGLDFDGQAYVPTLRFIQRCRQRVAHSLPLAPCGG